ncbi:hypothetical protein HAX54_028443 [Datura stramonium]|uniref:Uncharacterized protein n=1 Tax=Datura stramonium TaxID=4076 RepID=A0ABS8RKR3_DATST|nr:hypothetical protein [Datura stramonium]
MQRSITSSAKNVQPPARATTRAGEIWGTMRRVHKPQGTDTYCDSYFCLHELSLMMESNKRIIPVFCDVKPSELADMNVNFPNKDLEKFSLALRRQNVGSTFDTQRGLVGVFGESFGCNNEESVRGKERSASTERSSTVDNNFA